mmetsp:Transcript_19415/g.45896  ORF Transcript_19415/g.45896 Transcript_19415/m.45896 type:complete len:363 (+) Transcript_19415:704-1792(+)
MESGMVPSIWLSDRSRTIRVCQNWEISGDRMPPRPILRKLILVILPSWLHPINLRSHSSMPAGRSSAAMMRRWRSPPAGNGACHKPTAVSSGFSLAFCLAAFSASLAAFSASLSSTITSTSSTSSSSSTTATTSSSLISNPISLPPLSCSPPSVREKMTAVRAYRWRNLSESTSVRPGRAAAAAASVVRRRGSASTSHLSASRWAVPSVDTASGPLSAAATSKSAPASYRVAATGGRVGVAVGRAVGLTVGVPGLTVGRSVGLTVGSRVRSPDPSDPACLGLLLEEPSPKLMTPAPMHAPMAMAAATMTPSTARTTLVRLPPHRPPPVPFLATASSLLWGGLFSSSSSSTKSASASSPYAAP